MKIRKDLVLGYLLFGATAFGGLPTANATTIINGSYTLQSLDPAPTGTGFGNYNVILFQNAAGGSGNSGDGVNVDNSNQNLPTGDPNTDSGSLFWMTSVGDLRAFYDLSFGANKVTNIVLFFDVNETGQPQDLNLVTLDIWKNATTTTTAPNTALNPTGLNDLSSTQQQSIIGRTGGTLSTQLGTSPQLLGQVATGSGTDDWAIFTGINPYDPLLNANDTLLINFRINTLNNGPETLIISGTISNCDFPGQTCGGGLTTTGVPEPSTFVLLGAGLLIIGRRIRSKTE